MKIQKNVLIISGVVLLVIFLLAATFLLVVGIMRFNESEVSLQNAKSKLKEYYTRTPFPSQANVASQKDNIKLVNEWYDKLNAVLRKGQVDSSQKSPSIFMNQLQAKRPELINSANSGGLKVVDDNFGFGFERYFLNPNPPDPDCVPRLTQQLIIVEKLFEALVAEKVDKVTGIVRETFEEGSADGGAGSASQRGRGLDSGRGGDAQRLVNKNAGDLRPGDLYAKFHFVIDFRAKERVLWNVLNKLSSCEMYIVVTGIDVIKDEGDLVDMKSKKSDLAADESLLQVKKPVSRLLKAKAASDAVEGSAEAEKSLEKSGEPLARADRVVSGPEIEKPMKIKIELDVYKFRGE